MLCKFPACKCTQVGDCRALLPPAWVLGGGGQINARVVTDNTNRILPKSCSRENKLYSIILVVVVASRQLVLGLCFATQPNDSFAGGQTVPYHVGQDCLLIECIGAWEIINGNKARLVPRWLITKQMQANSGSCHPHDNTSKHWHCHLERDSWIVSSGLFMQVCCSKKVKSQLCWAHHSGWGGEEPLPAGKQNHLRSVQAEEIRGRHAKHLLIFLTVSLFRRWLWYCSTRHGARGLPEQMEHLHIYLFTPRLCSKIMLHHTSLAEAFMCSIFRDAFKEVGQGKPIGP